MSEQPLLSQTTENISIFSVFYVITDALSRRASLVLIRSWWLGADRSQSSESEEAESNLDDSIIMICIQTSTSYMNISKSLFTYFRMKTR